MLNVRDPVNPRILFGDVNGISGISTGNSSARRLADHPKKCVCLSRGNDGLMSAIVSFDALVA